MTQPFHLARRVFDQQDKANENKDIAPVQSQDKPADLANQALMEALQISFRILKVIMLILVAFFVFSGPSQKNIWAYVLNGGRPF